MKKRRRIFQRAAALLCCILLLPSLAAVPASAEVTSDDVFLDLLDYSGTQYFYTLTTDVNYLSLDIPYYSSVKYVDFVFFKSGGNINSVSCTIGSTATSLTISSLGNGYYRCYGAVSGSDFAIKVTFNISSTVWMQMASFKISLFNMDSFPDTAGLWVSDSPTSSGIINMPNSSTPVTAAMKYHSHVDDYSFEGYISDFNAQLYFPNWKKYDYIDVTLSLTDCNITSLLVVADDRFVPFEISFLGDSELEDFEVRYDQAESSSIYFPSIVDSYNRVILRVDLSQLNRASVSNLNVGITGQYSSNVSSITLRSVNGYVFHSVPSPLTSFWLKLKSFLSDLFGKDDPDAAAAQQSQQEINYSMNTQIVGAMEDWDTHIESVQAGYDAAFLNTTPALDWVGKLAESIFTNMGWFRSIYLLIGFMSVGMLLLSKSGLAHKIGSIARRK